MTMWAALLASRQADADVSKIGGRSDRRSAAVMVTLLCFGQMLNYFDRSVVAIASGAIMHDLHLSVAQYGLLASAFYGLYGVSGILVGLTLAQRVRPRLLLTAMIAIWTVVQLPIMVAPTLAVMIASRALLGAAESPSISTSVAAAHEWYAPHRRGLPTAIVMIGPLLGSIIAPPILTQIISNHSWRAGFLTCALLSGIMLALLLLFGRDGPDHSAAPSTLDAGPPDDGPAHRSIWLEPTLIAITFMGLCAYWITAFAVAWLFPVMQSGLGLGAQLSSYAVSAIFALSAVAMLASSSLSQALAGRGWRTRHAIVWPCILYLLTGALCFAATGFAHSTVARLAVLAIAISLMLPVTGAVPLLVSELAPPARRNMMLVVILSVTSLAGMAAPYVTGRLVGPDGFDGYRPALQLCAAIVFAGGLVAWLFIHPERPTAGQRHSSARVGAMPERVPTSLDDQGQQA